MCATRRPVSAARTRGDVMSLLDHAVPAALRGYKREWLARDVIAGVTLSAIAIPEVLGYTSISQTPLVTGLYTIIFPTMVFALLGSSKLLVVGADSATAALLAAGLTGLSISGLQPNTSEWVAYCGMVALITGGILVVARIFRLGFLGDFLSASVLIGFLTGVGVQVLSGQIPDILGVTKGTGSWVEQQIDWIKEIPNIQWETFAFGITTIAIILLFKRFAPKIPGAVVAVVLLIIVSTVTDAASHGVKVVGAVPDGFPSPLGIPQGIDMSNFAGLVGIAASCFVLIVAQSAATSRSFAMKHGDKVDVNRDIVGLSGANMAAGLTGTFVVNGSPTKTQILDGQGGRSQVANLTMAAVALLFTMYFTSVLTNMPKAVLAGIVFLIGVDLIDITGLKRIAARRKDEFVIALVTAVVVCAIGVEQGIVLAIVVSILDIIRRQYQPLAFVVGTTDIEHPVFQRAEPGVQSEPGLIVFRYDAQLFYANVNSFVDDVQRVIDAAPDPVRWLVIDASTLDDVDYSAGISLGGLLDYLDHHGVVLALARADSGLLATLRIYGLDTRIPSEHVFANLDDAVDAFHAATSRT
jgi:high affinity sulfate transporter 1